MTYADALTAPEWLRWGPVLAVVAGAPGTVMPPHWWKPLRAAGLVDRLAASRGWRLSLVGRAWWDERHPDTRAQLWTVGREMFAAWRGARPADVVGALNETRPMLWRAA